MEYASEQERATDIYLREFEIDCNKLYTTYLLESCVDDSFVNDSRALMEAEEGEEKPKSKFVAFIAGLCKRIRQVLSDIGEMFVNMVSKKPEATAEDFRKTASYSKEAMQRVEEIDQKLRESRKVVSAISKVTSNVGIGYDQVEAFLDDKAKKLRESDGLKVVGAAVAGTVAAVVFRKATNSGEAALKDIEETASKIAGNKEAETALGKVANKIRALTSEVYKVAAKGASAVSTAGSVAMNAGLSAGEEVNNQQRQAAKKSRKAGK